VEEALLGLLAETWNGLEAVEAFRAGCAFEFSLKLPNARQATLVQVVQKRGVPLR
jgi:hypothetical protein